MRFRAVALLLVGVERLARAVMVGGDRRDDRDVHGGDGATK